MGNWLTNWWARFSGMPLPETGDVSMKLMRGAIPSPRHRLCAAMPHIPKVQAPPQFLWKPARLSMWGNNQYGDCTAAEEAFSKGATARVFIPDELVISWARKNHAINGDTLIGVLDKMRARGFVVDGKTYDDGEPLSVDWTDAAVLQNAIAQGPVKIAVAADQLEGAVGDPPHMGWIGTSFTADQKLDHCVSLCGYGSISWLAGELNAKLPTRVDATKPAYALFTWSTIGIIDVPSLLAICGEAWLRNPTTIVK